MVLKSVELLVVKRLLVGGEKQEVIHGSSICDVQPGKLVKMIFDSRLYVFFI